MRLNQKALILVSGGILHSLLGYICRGRIHTYNVEIGSMTKGGSTLMHKLDEYKGQYIFLYTVDGKKLLCKPISIDEENQNEYIVDIIEPAKGHERGQQMISQDSIGY